MGPGTEETGVDALARADCDFCGHRHACFVGGEPSYAGVEARSAAAEQVSGWERHVCLGCLMRAATQGGFESCESCSLPVSMRGGSADAVAHPVVGQRSGNP